MSRLVEDLIVLAKTQRSDFLRREGVGLADLTDSVLTKARGLGERVWLLDDLADARTVADPQRLTQALLQLCHNAVKFSAPHSTIALGSAVDGRKACLWVRDQGVGLDQEEAHRMLGQLGYWESFWDTDQVFYGHVVGCKGHERRAVVLAVNDKQIPARQGAALCGAVRSDGQTRCRRSARTPPRDGWTGGRQAARSLTCRANFTPETSWCGALGEGAPQCGVL